MPKECIMKVTVLIPAAGSGTRMASTAKKQFLLLGGRPVLAHTLSRFEEIPEVTEVIPIVPEDEMENCLERCVDGQGLHKVRRVVPGGKQRQDSVYNGLKAADPDTDLVMVHDGVRPFVTSGLVNALIHSLDGCDGAILAVPAKDTLKEVGRDGFVRRTIDRESCYMVQTPQVFRYSVIMRAFASAYAEGHFATDEASLVERAGGVIRVVTGSYANIKITTPEDMILAEAILRKEAQDNAARPRSA